MRLGEGPPSNIWYHLTDHARFKLDPKYAPDDNAVAIEDRSGRKGIYLAQSVEKWVNGYGYWRPFVVEINVDPSVMGDPGVGGRWGGELFVPAASFGKLMIQRVIPIDAYAREEFGEPGWIESDLGVEFDTGKPILPHMRYRDYRYTGPDVRVMPPDEVTRLNQQLRRAKGGGARESSGAPPFVGDLLRLAASNDDFRRVLYTDGKSQIVLMSLRPGEDIGMEAHPETEQTLVIVDGHGHATVGGRFMQLEPGSAVVVPPGVRHNFQAGASGMKLYTTYAPPEHPQGLVQHRKP